MAPLNPTKEPFVPERKREEPEPQHDEVIDDVEETEAPLFKLSFNVDAAEAVAFGLRHRKAFGGSGDFTPRAPRSSEQIIQEGVDLLYRAADGIVYSWHPNPPLISSEEDCTAINSVSDITDSVLKAKIVGVLENHLGKSFVTYLGSRGPFNHKRFWLRVGDTIFRKVDEGKDAFLVVSFPELIAEGNHGGVVAAFCESISNYLQAGGESSIINFIEASGEKVHPTVRKYAFAKAVHCSSFPKNHRRALKHDIDLVLKEMIGAKGSGDLYDLRFLNKELVDEA